MIYWGEVVGDFLFGGWLGGVVSDGGFREFLLGDFVSDVCSTECTAVNPETAADDVRE